MRRLLAGAATALLLLLPSLAEAAPKARPRVGRSLRNDLSQPLRSVRPLPPRKGRPRPMPKPQPTTFESPLPSEEPQSVHSALSSGSAQAISAPLVNFEGIPNVSGVLPPDPNGDVGPAHFVQMVNSAFQIWDKSGNSLYGPADLATIWSGFGLPCEGTNDGDPIVLYDSIADRWLLSQFVASASPSFGECVAISQTGDPTGAYHRYYFPLSMTEFYDYPHFGVWPDGYYMGANRFAPSYVGSSVLVFERDQMLQGLPASYQEFSTSSSGTPIPADHDGPTLPPAGAPNFIAQIGATLRIYQFHVDWDTPANSTFSNPPTALPVSYNQLCPTGATPGTCVPQPGTNVELDTLGDRLMHRFAYRNFGTHESMVVNHSVKLGNGPSTRAAVQWFEIRRPGGTLGVHQQGTFDPDDGVWRWMGSIAMDGAGNIGMGYSVSDDTSVFPGIRYTGRLSSDATGTMPQGEQVLFSGGGSQLSAFSRWGDYSSTSIDPEDDCTFWHTNEYYPASPANDADWKTRIGAFDFGPENCTPTPKGRIEGTVRDAQDLAPIPGALVEADNGMSTLTSVAGAYSLILSPGNYDVTASTPGGACDAETELGVSVSNGNVSTVNFLLSGEPLLAANGFTINDAGGNNNGKVNRDECFDMSLAVRNTGCRKATAVSAALSTSTPGVTITQPNSNYADLAISASGGNLTPFGVLISNTFVCGTEIAFTLTVSMAEGAAQVVNFTAPTCQGTQVINGALSGTDASMGDRLGRLQPGGSCGAPKTCPGGFGSPGVYFYDTYTFTNTGDPGCFTVTLDPLTCTGANQLHSSAYLGTFNPADLCENFIADNGFDPTNVTNYSFELATDDTVTVVVNHSASNQSCAGYQLTMPAIDNSSGGGACGGGAPEMVPAALVVDDTGNDVLEVGESAVIAPEWSNDGTEAATGVTGDASDFQGAPSSPVVTTYALDDDAADYGTVPASSQATCADGTPNCYAGSISAPGTRPLHWDAEFLETLSTGETKTWNLHVGGSFSDVPTTQAFYSSIEALLHGDITGGCGGGAFCPAGPITRAQTAYVLLRAKEGAAFAPPPCDPDGEMFPDDVPESDPFCPWVEEAATRQIMSACSIDGLSFCPGLAVTREQMAAYLLRTIDGVGVPPPGCIEDSEPYDDVEFDSLFCRWIQEVKARGISQGCGANNYCPFGTVNRDVMAAVLRRALDLLLYAP